MVTGARTVARVVQSESLYPGPLGRFPPPRAKDSRGALGGSVCILAVEIPFSLCYAQVFRLIGLSPTGTLSGITQSIARPTGANGTNPERNGVSRILLLSGV